MFSTSENILSTYAKRTRNNISTNYMSLSATSEHEQDKTRMS